MRVMFRSLDGQSEPLEAFTDADGRLEQPLLEGAAFRIGRYELVFHVGDYFRAQDKEQGKEQGRDVSEPAFLDIVPIRFDDAGGAQ
jgi:5-hydroxyisourate hydrolase